MNRREFTERVKQEIRERSGGVCECHRMPADIIHLFPVNCRRRATQVDHVYADVLETDKSEPLTAEDGADLSDVCHAIKSATDQKMRAKRNKHSVRKGRPKSGWFRGKESKWPKGRKLQSRPFAKPPGKKEKAAPIRRGKAASRGREIP